MKCYRKVLSKSAQLRNITVTTPVGSYTTQTNAYHWVPPNSITGASRSPTAGIAPPSQVNINTRPRITPGQILSPISIVPVSAGAGAIYGGLKGYKVSPKSIEAITKGVKSGGKAGAEVGLVLLALSYLLSALS